ncbi:MAG TPA: hypothetical protein VHA33_21955 [Candidatus Angelobacter sp.]|jgi:hypothetical protein|nr:hypothetical protein [Candidatus Angelobacter sp.]
MLSDFILSWFSLPVLAVLAIIFVWYRLYKDFPLFFIYIIASELVTISRYIVHEITKSLPPTESWYQSFYWGSNLVLSVFGLMSVYEVFVRRLFVNFYKVRLYRLLFPTATLLIIAFSVITVALYRPEAVILGKVYGVLLFARGALLAFFVALMLLMGRTWTRYELGFALGLGALYVPSAFSLAMWTRALYAKWTANLAPIAWNVACLIWLVAFGKRPPPEVPVSPESLKPELLQQAREWEGTLRQWLSSKKE